MGAILARYSRRNRIRDGRSGMQTTLWFGVTIVGVAVRRGKSQHWNVVDQGVAVAVLIGGWLLLRME